jgi:hypothetical protein
LKQPLDIKISGPVPKFIPPNLGIGPIFIRSEGFNTHVRILKDFKPDLGVENANFPLPFPGFVDILVGFVPPCPVSKRIWV